MYKVGRGYAFLEEKTQRLVGRSESCTLSPVYFLEETLLVGRIWIRIPENEIHVSRDLFPLKARSSRGAPQPQYPSVFQRRWIGGMKMKRR